MAGLHTKENERRYKAHSDAQRITRMRRRYLWMVSRSQSAAMGQSVILVTGRFPTRGHRPGSIQHYSSLRHLGINVPTVRRQPCM